MATYNENKYESMKKYREKHRDKYLEGKRKYSKLHYENHKEEKRKKSLEYYHNTKNLKGSQSLRLSPSSILCECEGHYTMKNKSQHIKTKKHQQYLEKIQQSLSASTISHSGSSSITLIG
jgi:hypothetical protein